MGWLANWRRARTLRRFKLAEATWHAAVSRYAFTRALPEVGRSRLRELVTLFLHEKAIHGAGGLVLRDEIRMAIAIQACILILNLDLD